MPEFFINGNVAYKSDTTTQFLGLNARRAQPLKHNEIKSYCSNNRDKNKTF